MSDGNNRVLMVLGLKIEWEKKKQKMMEKSVLEIRQNRHYFNYLSRFPPKMTLSSRASTTKYWKNLVLVEESKGL